MTLFGAAHVQHARTLSIFFEENRGQAGPDSRFLARGGGYSLAFASQSTTVALRHSGKQISFRTEFAAANPSAAVRGEEKQAAKVHYFRGHSSVADIPTYARIRYENLYPSVDLVYYGNQRELEYDFVLRPGADAKAICLQFDGVDNLTVDPDGDLVIEVQGGSVVQRKPVGYQEYFGIRRPIEAQYRLIAPNTVTFQTGAYDHRRTLVIDPILSYSTFLGGNGDDDARAIATDSAGNVYITGSTTSSNFPTVAAVQGTPGNQDPNVNDNDAFVTKLNASGTALLFSTYLGGADDDVSNAIAVDASGNVIIAGSTASSAFPTTSGALRRTCNIATGGNCFDAFVAKLNPIGNALVYSTYLGGTGDDEARGVAVDSSGNAYVTGKTASSGAFRPTPVPEDLSQNSARQAPLFTRRTQVQGQRNPTGLPSIRLGMPPSPERHRPRRQPEQMSLSPGLIPQEPASPTARSYEAPKTMRVQV